MILDIYKIYKNRPWWVPSSHLSAAQSSGEQHCRNLTSTAWTGKCAWTIFTLYFRIYYWGGGGNDETSDFKILLLFSQIM